MKANDLKSLEVRRAKLEREINEFENDKNEVCKRLRQKKEQLHKINNDIKQIQANVVIREHAVLRYLERVKGINMAETEKEILDEELRKQILTLGSGKFPKNDFTLIVKNNVIVTVVKEG